MWHVIHFHEVEISTHRYIVTNMLVVEQPCKYFGGTRESITKNFNSSNKISTRGVL